MSKDQIYTIADFNSVKKRVEDLKNRSDDIKSRLAATLKKLWNTERLLRAVPESTDFSLLRQRFPHFEEVIDFYQNTVISLARLNLPFEIPPILLQGDPGLGKTYFVSELAKLINIPFSEISLATITSSFLLSGGGLQWSEGSVGLISETLVSSPIANPMILIDEIDKASGDSRYNPMNVFYSLLEPHSAKRFRDEALEIELDASKLIWIATGNYIRNIPAPIQSRMRVFHIEQPAPEKMLTVIGSIYDHIIRNKVYGQLLDSVLDEEVLNKLANQSPRAVRLAIEEAAFKAIRNQRSVITTSDLPITKKEKYRVGFI
jgi:ATP-dependent Lon protease